MAKLSKTYYFILITAVITLLFISCNRKSVMSQSEYISFLNSDESSLVISKSIDKIIFKCKLQPARLITLSLDKNYNNEQDFLKDLEYYKDQINIVLIIEDIDKTSHEVKKTVFDVQKFGNFLSYANTDLKNDIELKLDNGDIVSCDLVHMEPANSIKPVIRITASFKKKGINDKECTVIFDDNLFNHGPMKFYYENNVFENLPKLKFTI